jgi:dihydrofolate reductase
MISLIAAIGKNGEIGIDGQLPWGLKSDLQHFKNLTSGNVVIMGRKTFESIGRPLPNRINIVITRNKDFQHEGIIVADSVQAALKLSEGYKPEEVFIIGGAEIYKQTLSLADKLYITEVEFSDDKADTYFPQIDPKVWKETYRQNFMADEDNQYNFSFVEYEKRSEQV